MFDKCNYLDTEDLVPNQYKCIVPTRASGMLMGELPRVKGNVRSISTSLLSKKFKGRLREAHLHSDAHIYLYLLAIYLGM